jgi:hypothetical protein
MTSKVMFCGCTTAGVITAKSAAVKSDMKPKTEAPIHTRENGAHAQDAMYGAGNRLFNERASKNGGFRCTNCGKVRS